MKLYFKTWLENNKPIGWRGALKGILKSTCGDKSCSRGSTPWWALGSEEEAFRSPNLTPIRVNLGQNIKAAYNSDSSVLVLAVDKTPEMSHNPGKLIEDVTKKIYINQSQILSFVNELFKKQELSGEQAKNYTKLDYSRYYISKNSYIIEYKVS